MLRPTSVCALLWSTIALATTVASAEPSTRVALVGGMLLDGYGGVPVHHAAILVENNRIVAAGPASEVVIPPGTPVIDTRGETMMPGMIELHAHLVLVGDGDIGRWFKWLESHRNAYQCEFRWCPPPQCRTSDE
jgi:imidazolonepropionase-like amidohydrolase